MSPVEQREFAEELGALATLKARESVDITANVTEKVQAVRFKDGDRVKAGEVLIELVRDEEYSRLQQARAEVAQQTAELERTETLARDNIATPSERDAQRTRLQTATAALRTIEAQLGDRLVRAPFAGVLGLRRVSPGSLVSPNTVITSLDAIDSLYADIPLPERFLAQLSVGQDVSLKTDAYPDLEVSGRVAAIDGRVDPMTRSVTVRAEVPNTDGKLRPGMLLRARLRAGKRTSMAVPETALVQRASRAFVYTLDENKKVALRDVQVGRRSPGWVEILAGLKGDEQVIHEGTHRVAPGDSVKVVDGVANPNADANANAQSPSKAPLTLTR
jgi:membrane fusion protein (multidrug efflux system)